MSTARTTAAVPTPAEPDPAAPVPVARARGRAASPAIAVWAGGALLAAHGLIHLMGVAIFWHLAEPGGLRYGDVSPLPGSMAGLLVGAVWLACAALFVLAAGLLVAHRARWRAAALAAVVLSVPVLGPLASMAPLGLALDGVILLVVILTWGSARRVPQPQQQQPGQES